jgi:hypothetical protein
MRIHAGAVLSLLMRPRNDENTVWTDSQDYGVDEILHISKKTLFCKITRITSEIITLFRVPPQLFQAKLHKILFLADKQQKAN